MSSYTSYKPEWIREDFVDFIAEKINPTWAWKKVKASVVEVKALSEDFFYIRLRPNSNFKHDQLEAGQNILVTVLVAGVHEQRAYSILEYLENGDITIAVKVQGIVSKALSQMQMGEVLEISQPQGDFTLEPVDQDHPSILLIASGSGITAIYSLLRAALLKDFKSIDLIYFTRDDAFHVELEQLAQQYPHLNYHHVNTVKTQRHFDLSLLERFVPEFQSYMTYACGSVSMMNSIQEIYQQRDLLPRLKQEYFQIIVDENLASQPVEFVRAQQSFQAHGSLLDSAEQAGLKPASGCRMGVCNTCTCTKVSGSTKNMLTGEINHDANTQIKLCISQAISPVVINL
ncbi:flavin reductase family protein [Acinetobacter shaoyimingii]|uniref:Iron-sulfur cluster-binding domain-containing protein n=1 Tax=Acinetobacter shaoyimingii TaxID=2715164 RepID=A0A6G8RRW5_9GAMM|nr:iron-sulfur cluster-binding domain-containing protein [Acinetobacter shaoyimingii]QIO04528.1 iron-sulfur cluster-binding domain-containing protein [Acinetobacter shaoyimingii]